MSDVRVITDADRQRPVGRAEVPRTGGVGRRVSARTDLKFVLMRTPFDHEALQDYVVEHAFAVGIEGRPDLASAVGFHPSRLSRWYSGAEQPSVSNLRDLAPVIKAPLLKLLVLAGHVTAEELDVDPRDLETAPARQNPQHPLARELDAMLDPASKLSDEDRETVETFVDRFLDSYRRKMRARVRKAS